MKWIVCIQLPNDIIKYRSDNIETNSYMNYNSFVYEFLPSIYTQPNLGLVDALNKFQLIYIDIETETWEVVKFDSSAEVSFDELLTINQSSSKEEISLVEKCKIFVTNVSNKYNTSRKFK